MLIAILAISACAVLKPIGHITLNEEPEFPKESSGIQNPVSITAILTGWVEAPAFILMDQEDALTPDVYRKPQWVPSLAYIVTHPTQGTVIMDFGLKEGKCAYGLKPVYWVPCRNEGHESLAAYLKANKSVLSDLKFLIPSHFHGDHVSGLSDVLMLTNAPLLMSKATLAELESRTRVFAGVPTEMLKTDMTIVLMDKGFTSDPELGHVFDIFGDGSLKLFETPGHSDGHISALAKTTDGTVLLTFDASHLSANYTLQIPSGAVSGKSDAVESLKHLQSLEKALGDIQIVFGHDPKQWQCAESVVSLDGVTPLGC